MHYGAFLKKLKLKKTFWQAFLQIIQYLYVKGDINEQKYEMLRCDRNSKLTCETSFMTLTFFPKENNLSECVRLTLLYVIGLI